MNAPQYAFIKEKMATDDFDNVPKLTDNSRPTPNERALIAAWAQVRADCVRRQVDVVRNNNILLPASMNYTISQMPKMNSVAAELASGQLTYGEHNRRLPPMLTVETIARVRREHAKGKSVRAIARSSKVSRETVSKYLGSGATAPRCERQVQPYPQLEAFRGSGANCGARSTTLAC